MRRLDRVSFRTREGAVTAVASWRASANDRLSAVPSMRAVWLVRHLARDASRPILAAIFGLTTGADAYDPSRVMPAKLVSGICAALESGKLLLLADESTGQSAQTGVPTAGLKSALAEQRLISEVMAGRSALSFEGVRYRLAAAEGGSPARGHTEYGPIASTEASELIKRMGESLATSPPQRTLWAELREAVNRPEEKSRVVLLRPREVRYAPPPVPEPEPAKPAPRAPVSKKEWIELQIQFEDGTPFPGNCVVELSSGIRTDGAPDDEGMIRIEDIDPGECKVSFPDLDATTWNTA